MTDFAVTDIVFSPLLPLWLTGLLAALILALLLLGLRAGARGTGWRLAAFALLLAMLSGPTLRQEERRPLPDIALIAVDHSPSQDLGNRSAIRDRAAAELEAALAGLDGLEVRRVTLGSAAEPETRLVGALDQALQDVPRRQLAGVVVLSDGALHDDPADLAGLTGAAPRHLLLTAPEAETDRSVHILRAPQFGVVGDSLELAVRLDDSFSGVSGPAELRISLDGQEVRRLTVRPGQETPVSVPITRAGPHLLEVAAPELPGELAAYNNRTLHPFDGVRDRLRVLLISGLPYSGERAWRNTLKSDPSVDLVHFTILRSTGHEDPTPTNELSLISFPVFELFEERIDEFDLIILDRYQRRGLLPPQYFSNIADYVRDGGALLLITGPAFAGPFGTFDTGLGEILPGVPTGAVLDGPYRPTPTPVGLRHPVVAGLPGLTGDATRARWGHWLRQIPLTAAADTVLLEGLEGAPLLILDRIGEGRVAQLASDHIWLWQRGFDGGGPQAELTRRLAHWLMGEPDLEEERLIARVGEDNIAHLERTTLGEVTDPAMITDPNGGVTPLHMAATGAGHFSANFRLDQPGVFEVLQQGLAAIVGSTASFAPEWQRILPDRAALEALAAAGWSLNQAAASPQVRFRRAGAEMFAEDWIGFQRNRQTAVISTRQTPLLPPTLAVVLLLCAVGLAWWREGRSREAPGG